MSWLIRSLMSYKFACDHLVTVKIKNKTNFPNLSTLMNIFILQKGIIVLRMEFLEFYFGKKCALIASYSYGYMLYYYY